MTAQERDEANVLRRAGHGDVAAQIEISQIAMSDAPMTWHKLAIAETFARMAAGQNSAPGFQQLAAVLMVQAGAASESGDSDKAIERAAHAMAIYDLLADAGLDDASPVLAQILEAAEVDGLRERAVALAKTMATMDLACG